MQQNKQDEAMIIVNIANNLWEKFDDFFHFEFIFLFFDGFIYNLYY